MREAPSNVVKLRAVESPKPPPAPSMVLASLDELIAHTATPDRLPLALALATRLSELAARILESSPDAQRAEFPAGPSRLLTVDEAARMAGVTRRWIYDHTKGLKFRRELSRKNLRLEEAGFLRWLEFQRP